MVKKYSNRKKRYSKKRYAKKRYSKKRYSKKRYSKKRYAKRKIMKGGSQEGLPEGAIVDPAYPVARCKYNYRGMTRHGTVHQTFEDVRRCPVEYPEKVETLTGCCGAATWGSGWGKGPCLLCYKKTSELHIKPECMSCMEPMLNANNRFLSPADPLSGAVTDMDPHVCLGEIARTYPTPLLTDNNPNNIFNWMAGEERDANNDVVQAHTRNREEELKKFILSMDGTGNLLCGACVRGIARTAADGAVFQAEHRKTAGRCPMCRIPFVFNHRGMPLDPGRLPANTVIAFQRLVDAANTEAWRMHRAGGPIPPPPPAAVTHSYLRKLTEEEKEMIKRMLDSGLGAEINTAQNEEIAEGRHRRKGLSDTRKALIAAGTVAVAIAGTAAYMGSQPTGIRAHDTPAQQTMATLGDPASHTWTGIKAGGFVADG